MRQPDNYVVVVEVAESGVVPALPSGLVQHQIPAVHSGKEVLVLSEKCGKWEILLFLLQFEAKQQHF